MPGKILKDIINEKRGKTSSNSILREMKGRLKKKKKMAEGFGPIYKDGKIAPGYEGLGPKYEKDLGPMKQMPKKPIKKKKIVPKQKYKPEAPGKRYYA